MKIAVDCYELTRQLPPEEVNGTTSQIRSASSRIAASIAEGYGRGDRIGYIHCLRIAQGSLKELETYLILSCMVGLAGDEPVNAILDECENEGKMLGSLIRSLEVTD